MNRLVIIGAGGHGKAIADNALKNGYTDINFVDDSTVGECMGFPIVGKTADIGAMDDGRTDFVIGIGNNSVRKALAEGFSVNWVALIHPSAQIAADASVGKGSVIMAGVVINACARVGMHCIVNTGAIVEHDNVIEDYVHISPNAALGGTVCVGKSTHIGMSATVINNISVCGGCTIGAGAVVISNITDQGTYVGVPARKIR